MESKFLTVPGTIIKRYPCDGAVAGFQLKANPPIPWVIGMFYKMFLFKFSNFKILESDDNSIKSVI